MRFPHDEGMPKPIRNIHACKVFYPPNINNKLSLKKNSSELGAALEYSLVDGSASSTNKQEQIVQGVLESRSVGIFQSHPKNPMPGLSRVPSSPAHSGILGFSQLRGSAQILGKSAKLHEIHQFSGTHRIKNFPSFSSLPRSTFSPRKSWDGAWSELG